MLLKIDTDKKIITEFNAINANFFPKWEINRITDYVYWSDTIIGMNSDGGTHASFNRWTGSYTSRVRTGNPIYTYNCEPTKQLY